MEADEIVAREQLEKFVLDNPELELLEAGLGRFNVFDVLQAGKAELRHSNVLAWLLDPSANHGLGPWFLGEFLKRSVALHNSRELPLSVLELEVLDYGDVEIRREWEKIDLLIVIHDVSPPIVVAIENKIAAGEHGDQLARYRATTERHFPEARKIWLFLTPDAREPISDDRWLPVDWAVVSALLERLLSHRAASLGEDAARFLTQYHEILRRCVVAEQEIAELCRKIYAKHRDAIDLLFEHRPDLLTEIQEFMEQQIAARSSDLIADHSNKTSIRFTHRDLEAMVKCRGSGWTASGRMLLFEVHNYHDKVSVRVYIGPGAEADRKELLDCCLRDIKLFPRAGRTFGSKWHCVRQDELIPAKDLAGAMSLDDVSGALEDRFAVYLKDVVPKVVAHFGHCWGK